jgi:hypothetical protein
MPAEGLPMRQVREVLRLKHAAGVNKRHIAGALRISRSTVAEYLRRAVVVGITCGLDRLPRQRSGILWRRYPSARLRQSEGRCHRNVPLRAEDQPNLPGDGGALWH